LIARTTPTRMPIPMGIRIDIVMARLVNMETQYGRKALFESTGSLLLPPAFQVPCSVCYPWHRGHQ
jgi:hypothetical protein